MNDQADTTCRRTVHYTGRVQGVGFRYTTQRTAGRFDVTGFVRNLPDGRVEMIAEGSPDELDRFQQAVADAMEGHITKADVSAGRATGEFRGFTIAF